MAHNTLIKMQITLYPASKSKLKAMEAPQQTHLKLKARSLITKSSSLT